MHILITGGAGFIGSNLSQRLLDKSYKVSIVDNLSSGNKNFLPENIQKYFDDFSSKNILKKIFNQKFDVVIHLAALPRVQYSVEFPLESHKNNVTKTLKLIDACKGNVKRFIFASSSSVYGEADVSFGPTKENCQKNPKSPYALQKSIIEDYLKLYYNLYNFESVSLRFFNVFGPNQLGDSAYSTAISAWLTAIMKGLPMRKDGSGLQSRDMCYVDNVLEAIVKVSEKNDDLKGEYYNVACGEKIVNNDILNFLLKRFPQASVVNAPARIGDVMHTHADISKAYKDFGYAPIVSFWDGLEKTINWNIKYYL
jgi:UDP-glucose 4-epimerase